MIKSIKRKINKLYSKIYLTTNSNLKNQLTTDFQRVKLDDKSLNKLPEFLQYSLPAIFAKVDYLDGSTVILKVVYLERIEDEIVDIDREFRFNIEDINFLEIETTT